MRGEKPKRTNKPPPLVGSPPRARGEGQGVCGAAESRGITPACAGRSQTACGPAWSRRDHPRVRGEKPTCTRAETTSRGSPPRARGEAQVGPVAARLIGITPACAGRRRTKSYTPRRSRDHPRVRGEKKILDRFSCLPPGSPPRARGEVKERWGIEVEHRITPACAGRRVQNHRKIRPNQDHPRVRGEKPNASTRAGRGRGSPPRARGKAGLRAVQLHAHRITPACAGKRWQGKDLYKKMWDHPRVRGEKAPARRRPGDHRGSPPRARGKD